MYVQAYRKSVVYEIRKYQMQIETAFNLVRRVIIDYTHETRAFYSKTRPSNRNFAADVSSVNGKQKESGRRTAKEKGEGAGRNRGKGDRRGERRPRS